MENNEKTKREKKAQRTYPINVAGGYYARTEQEYQFDRMLREHAKKASADNMYNYIQNQMMRNYLRRIDEKLEHIEKKLTTVEELLNAQR